MAPVPAKLHQNPLALRKQATNRPSPRLLKRKNEEVVLVRARHAVALVLAASHEAAAVESLIRVPGLAPDPALVRIVVGDRDPIRVKGAITLSVTVEEIATQIKIIITEVAVTHNVVDSRTADEGGIIITTTIVEVTTTGRIIIDHITTTTITIKVINRAFKKCNFLT